MKLNISINNVIIDDSNILNAGEYNIHEVEFVFDEAYEGLIKKAVFSAGDSNYLVAIIDNKCTIPYEVLEKNETITIGVFAYELESDELKLRYSPAPCYVNINEGSYKENYDNYNVPAPDVVEQLESEINAKQDELVSGTNIKTINNESILGEGNIDIQGGATYEAGENIIITDNIISAIDTKYTAGTNVSISNANVISATDTIYDDTQVKTDITNLQNNKADKTEIPDVSNFITKSVDDLTNYYKKTETYTQTEVNSLIGAISTINILVVQALPTEDISTTTIYLVPKQTALTNNVYDEYIYVSNAWEKIGDTQIDLSNYIQKSLTSGLVKNDGTIDTNSYLTQHQDISGKEDISNKVTSISSGSTDTQYPSAKCVYDIVGDIETLLTTITTGTGV